MLLQTGGRMAAMRSWAHVLNYACSKWNRIDVSAQGCLSTRETQKLTIKWRKRKILQQDGVDNGASSSKHPNMHRKQQASSQEHTSYQRKTEPRSTTIEIKHKEAKSVELGSATLRSPTNQNIKNSPKPPLL